MKESKIEKILVITSCSKKKAKKPKKAVDLYQGQFYSGVKKFSRKMDYDLMVLSAKHGLVKNQVISPYDLRLITKKQVRALEKTEIKKFNRLLGKYDKVILLMGKKYSSVFESVNSRKIIKASDNRGSGGFLQLIKYLNNTPGRKIKNLVKKENRVTVDILKRYRDRV